MNFKIVRTTQFKKDYKLAQKRNMDLNRLKNTIVKLIDGQKLPTDHVLSGNWNGYHECHILPDWLLIYTIKNDVIVLVRTGTHSDLFG